MRLLITLCMLGFLVFVGIPAFFFILGMLELVQQFLAQAL